MEKKAWKVVLMVLGGILGVVAGAFFFGSLALRIEEFKEGEPLFSLQVLLEPEAYLYGLVFTALLLVMYFALARRKVSAKKLMTGGSKKGRRGPDGLFSPLENSRFLTDKERDKYFPGFRDRKSTRLNSSH